MLEERIRDDWTVFFVLGRVDIDKSERLPSHCLYVFGVFCRNDDIHELRTHYAGHHRTPGRIIRFKAKFVNDG